MPLTPEQNATLQLLLERGQSYADLATLLGVAEAEVRARARAALESLGGEDPDRHVALTDYLLGQADPIGRADVVRHLRDDSADHALATELAAILRETYPAAELPRLPGEPRSPRRPRRAADDAGRGLPALSQMQTRLVAILAAAAILLVVAVLAITGAFGGGDDGGEPSAASETTTTPESAADEQIQRVPLTARGGGDASGEAVFGLATGDQPFIDLSIRGLDPAPRDQAYVVWLLLNETQGYPLTPLAVNAQGSFDDRFAIPSAVLPVVARIRSVEIAIAPVKDVQDVVRDAIEETKLIVERPGETVLAGTIPRAEQQPEEG